MHHRGGAAAAREKALEMLEAVQIRDPERVYELYPHEVSGGMGQRVMIAMMLMPEPELLIADEPTSALDVTVRMQVLGILDDLVRERGMGLIFISHDLNLVAQLLRPRAGHVRGPRRRGAAGGRARERAAPLYARAARRAAAHRRQPRRRCRCCGARQLEAAAGGGNP